MEKKLAVLQTKFFDKINFNLLINLFEPFRYTILNISVQELKWCDKLNPTGNTLNKLLWMQIG